MQGDFRTVMSLGRAMPAARRQLALADVGLATIRCALCASSPAVQSKIERTGRRTAERPQHGIHHIGQFR